MCLYLYLPGSLIALQQIKEQLPVPNARLRAHLVRSARRSFDDVVMPPTLHVIHPASIQAICGEIEPQHLWMVERIFHQSDDTRMVNAAGKPIITQQKNKMTVISCFQELHYSIRPMLGRVILITDTIKLKVRRENKGWSLIPKNCYGLQ